MKKISLILVIMFVCLHMKAQTNNAGFNKSLADSLGGDEYGMKQYILAILKTGPNQVETKQIADSLFRGHMSNIERLSAEGKLIVAGPLKKNERAYRGIFILNVKTIDEANALLSTDPTIAEKVFDVELYQWYGSAALPMYLPAHKMIEKTKH